MRIYLLLAMAVGASFVGSSCGGSGVGDPCVPEDEYFTTFSGYSVSEVNIESRSFQCETRVCLVNHFQGRVSCPYGQIEDPTLGDDNGRALCGPQYDPALEGNDARDSAYTCTGGGSECASPDCQPGGSTWRSSCRVPDRDGSQLEDRIQVPIEAQLNQRQAHEAVYCSCRCAGPEANARYCECPSGFTCEELVEDYGFGKGELAGSYCVKDGTSYVPSEVSETNLCNGSNLCGSECDGCEERDESGACVKEAENPDCFDAEIVFTNATGALEKRRTARNPGGQCEGKDIVCGEDTQCCRGSLDGNEVGTVEKTPCSDVGVAITLADGEEVRVCP